MNILIWILQGLMALTILMTGFMKVNNSNDELKKKGIGRMDWADDLSPLNLAAFGLILPQLPGTLQWLTPLAAMGVILTMLGAIVLHVRRRNGIQAVVKSIVILVIALVINSDRFALLMV
ncbi:DoxX family protein [Draconibacterium sp.]|nr:DoxX family protein [Draconibacterium sp.]